MDNGSLSGGSISVDPDPACVNDTITFTLTGVTDTGGTKRVDCELVNIPPATPTYAWEITKPGGTTVNGSGSVATVVGDNPGQYTCTFTATVSRECPPADLVVGETTTVVDIDSITVEAENGLTECMEGRQVTYTATIQGTIPANQKPITYTFHFERADGTPWTATVVSNELQVDYDGATADQVPDGDPDHFFDTPIYVEAQLQTCDPMVSPTITVRVYELWIEYFRDNGIGNPWKVVVARAMAYSAIASSDCTNWDWDMEGGFPDVWNPTGGTLKTATGMVIPSSDLPSDNAWGYFGDTYGTANVFCEDGEGNNHRIYSTDLGPPTRAKVFFLKNAVTHPGGVTPNWYYYWSEILPHWRIATSTWAGVAGGSYASTNPVTRTTTIYQAAGEWNSVTGHRGIHTYYETLAHENHHIVMWEGWWGVRGTPDPANDTDSDAYPDSWESTDPVAIAYGFVVGVNDSYNIPGSAGYTYEEDMCEAVEHALVETAYDSSDWSFDPAGVNQGKQW